MGKVAGVAVALLGVIVLVLFFVVKGSLNVWLGVLVYVVAVFTAAVIMGKIFKAADKRRQGDTAKAALSEARQELAESLAKIVEYEKRGFRLKNLHHHRKGWNGYWEIDSLLQDAFLTAIGAEVRGKLSDPEEAFPIIERARALIRKADQLTDEFVERFSTNESLLANLEERVVRLKNAVSFVENSGKASETDRKIGLLVLAAYQKCAEALEKNSMENQLFDEAEKDLFVAKALVEEAESYFDNRFE